MVALLAGCSSGSDHHPEAAPASTTTVPSTTTAAPKTTVTVPTDDGEPADPSEYRQEEGALGKPGYFFRTPSGNFSCAVFDKPVRFGEVSVTVGCQGTAAAVPTGSKTCLDAEGVPAFGLTATGAEFTCAAGDLFAGRTDAGVLEYGTHVQVGNQICASHRVGITCRQLDSGASFFVSKEAGILKN